MDAITVRIEAPESVREGDPIPYAVIVANESDHQQEVHLQGREIVFDVTVAREHGRPLWRRLAGEAVEAILRLDTFSAGESRRLEGLIDSRVLKPGHYVMQAMVPTETGTLASAPHPLQVIGPP